MPLLQRSAKALKHETDIASVEMLLLPTLGEALDDATLAKLREGSKLARKAMRQTEATAFAAAATTDEDGGLVPFVYDVRPALLQAELAWRLGNTDLAILLHQKAQRLFPSLSQCPVKVRLQQSLWLKSEGRRCGLKSSTIPFPSVRYI